MFENLTHAHTEMLDELLKTRHTVRLFTPTHPDKTEIEQIVRAGLIAPFAALPAKGKTDFRKIIVIPVSSDAMVSVENIIRDRIPKFIDEMKERVDIPPLERGNFESLAPLLGKAPYLVIAAERKGFPHTYMANASISLSYCMYNMWLKAISLKIGFRLVSLIVHLMLGNDTEFCQLLDIPCTEYALDACALGYPSHTYRLPRVNYPDYESNVTWL